MDTHLDRLLHLFDRPAFIASDQAEILFLNPAMQQLTGRSDVSLPNITLIGLGIFRNQAEYRGFIRGFTTVGPLQRIRLPSNRLQNTDQEVVLQAVRLELEGLVVGMIHLRETPPTSDGEESRILQSVIDYLPQMLIMTDGKGHITYYNQRAATHLFDDDAPSFKPTNILHLDAELTESLWREYLIKARRKGYFLYDTHFQRPDGRLLPVEVVISQIEGFPVHTVTLVAQDITSRRTNQRNLEAAKLEIERLLYNQRREKLISEDHLIKGSALKAIVTANKKYRYLLEDLQRVARTDTTVLITGETGTGKELIARAIHQESLRANETLVIVNCGALPRELIESELFGYLKGAFTGATRNHPGRFQLANGGTLFLDEVGELELSLQTRLLRFLQEGEYTPLGSTKLHYADVRVIAATNRNLSSMVQEKTFRADLYFRLNVFPIVNPPLRERREDIPVLIEHFIDKHRRRLNSKVEKVSQAFLDYCAQHSFPGNIRELENIVERALITSPALTLLPDFHPDGVAGIISPANRAKPDTTSYNRLGDDGENSFLHLDAMQKAYIERVLRYANGKVSGPGGAAELLGLNPQTLYSKIRKLGIRKHR